mmetsp:Transcript_38655/g.111638  ORF Transcript_38655/g.111638 Transcript_38655/m.111638 type:complete len:416 (+) Transcript_38655:86-1333(+)
MLAALLRVSTVVWSILGAGANRIGASRAVADVAHERAAEAFNPKPFLVGALARPLAPSARLSTELSYEFSGPATSASGPFPPRVSAMSRVRNPLRFQPGENLVQDRYPWSLKAEEQIGRSSRGQVWKCRLTTQDGVDKDVAVKIENLFRITPEGVLTRTKAMREVESMEKFNGGPFVDYIGYWERKGSLLIIMELTDGNIADTVLAQPFEVFDLPIRIQLFTQLMEGIRTMAEQGYVHRSIWPANLLLKADGNDVHLKICDFGHASSLIKQPGELWHETDGRKKTIGAPLYRPPEGWEGRWSVKSDVYSAGLVLYRLLFEGAMPPEPSGVGPDHPEYAERFSQYDVKKDALLGAATVLAHQDPGISQLLALLPRMLARDVRERASAEEVLEVLYALPEMDEWPVKILREVQNLYR